MREKADLEHKISDYLNGLGIKRGANIVVACSGGPDSTALLYALSRISVQRDLVLSSAYLDHGIRDSDEADGDIEFLSAITSRLGIPLYVERKSAGELRRIAKRAKRSLEAVARDCRYGYLADVASETSADYIATGHTLDDQIETILMRFFQGASLFGLSGIPSVRDRIIRPILCATREEVLAYLQIHGIGYRTDKSNLSDDFLRNKIRIELVPVVQRVFPQYKKTLLFVSETARSFTKFVDGEVRDSLQWERVQGVSGTAFRIQGQSFISVNGVVRLRSLYLMLNELARLEPSRKGAKQVPFRFVSPLLDDSWFYPKRLLLNGHGITLEWRGEFLFLERKVVSLYKKGYLINVKFGSISLIKGVNLEVVATKGPPDSRDQLVVLRDEIVGPLVVRSRRSGDQIELSMGLKSLKKLFNEWGVSREERWLMPVIADRKGILAVLGSCTGFKNRYSRRANNWYSNQSGSSTYTAKIKIVKVG